MEILVELPAHRPQRNCATISSHSPRTAFVAVPKRFLGTILSPIWAESGVGGLKAESGAASAREAFTDVR